MKDNYCKNFLIGLLCSCTLLISVSTSAQNVTIPRPSQYATITQRVGISDITITYHSPSVSERAIWGGLVPYDQIWRAGANENTTISFTHDAKIEGKDVKAGTYGLFMMPKQDKVLLFLSRYSQSWGTNYPKEDELVLNASVKYQEIPVQEWLSYDFIDRGGNEVTAVLRWEKKQIPFKISFDVPNIVIENMRAELKGPAGFTWRGYSTAAQFCLQNDTNLEEAMAWVDQSITLSKGYTNLVVKAGLLNKKGEVEEAKKV
ncbi:MAG: DUF2911 domain-containing protein, partial [Cyclobacteriaceae bacterium]